jgi:hypothetical protein
MTGSAKRSIRLRDAWAQRELKVVVRDSQHLSSTGRLVLDHLRAAEGREQEAVRMDRAKRNPSS